MKPNFIIKITLCTTLCAANAISMEESQKHPLQRMETAEYLGDLNKVALSLLDSQEGLFEFLDNTRETLKSRHIPTSIFSKQSDFVQSKNNLQKIRDLWLTPDTNKIGVTVNGQIEGYKQMDDNTIKLYEEISKRLEIILEKSKPLGLHTQGTKQKFQEVENSIAQLQNKLEQAYNGFKTNLSVVEKSLDRNESYLSACQFQLEFVSKMNNIYQESIRLYKSLT